MFQRLPSCNIAGRHVILELYRVNADLLSDCKTLEELLVKSARDTGATVLHSYFHPFGPECGITGVIALSESHISIHTWPEHMYAAIDIFMCGDCDPLLAAKYITTHFYGSADAYYQVMEIARGTRLSNV